LEAERHLRGRLTSIRTSFVDLLAGTLPRFPSETRRFLLAVKRDAFNGRELARHTAHPEWPVLESVTDGLARKLLDLEAEAYQLDAEFLSCYEQERDRERRHLFEHLIDTRFLRGVALSSPDLVDRAMVLSRRPAGRFGRRERKVEQSLLRFVTRAAAKLSPCSTLTAFALGAVSENADPGQWGILDADLREISLVRASRHVLESYQTLLLRHPGVRDRCYLALNDTAEEIEPGRYRLLRPGHWQLDPDRGEFTYAPAAQVRVTLNSTLVKSMRRLLAPGPGLYSAVVRELATSEVVTERGEEIHSRIERLVSVGFVNLLPPWPTYEPRLEESLLCLLRSLSTDAALDEAAQALELLVDLERRYASQVRPAEAARYMVSALHQFAAAVDHATGNDTSSDSWGTQLLHEDVLLVPAASDPERLQALRISSQQISAIMECAELVSRFASLYNHRHDFLHTLAAFWAARWPSRHEIPLLELFWEAQPLWRQYLRFDHDHRFHSFSSFNPSALASIDSLNRLREKIFNDAQTLMREGAPGSYLAPESLSALLELVPARYQPLLGGSVFVQPAEPGGGLWVLNRLFEGTGRYLSRYGTALDEPARSRYSDHLRQRSVVEIDGEDVELLDLMFSSLSSTNVHSPQTRRILQSPGEHIGSFVSGRVLLSELRIQADLSTASFRVIDSQGQRLLPVHLSSLNNLFLPAILRFLSVFGPHEVRQVFPRPQPVAPGTFERLTCGPLILRRKRWELDISSIDIPTAHETGPEAFRRIHHWRRSVGLPRQVFVFEPIRQPDGAVQNSKPQYLDLSSPSLVSVFVSILRTISDRLILEEALPSFPDFPLDSAGRPRGVEIQIDSLALRPLLPASLLEEPGRLTSIQPNPRGRGDDLLDTLKNKEVRYGREEEGRDHELGGRKPGGGGVERLGPRVHFGGGGGQQHPQRR